MPRLKILHRHHNRRTSATDGARSASNTATQATETVSASTSQPTASPIQGGLSKPASNTPFTAALDNRPKGLSKPSLSEPVVTNHHHGSAVASTTSLHLAASPITPINTNTSSNTNSPQAPAPPPRSNTLPLPIATIPKTNSSSSLYSSFQKEMAASATATKLNAKKFLNPMAILSRRKSAQQDGDAHSSKKEKKEKKEKKGHHYEEPGYTPYTIVATRHPDWSLPSKRATPDDQKNGPNQPRLSLQTSYDSASPIPIPKHVEKTPVFKECFDEADIPLTPVAVEPKITKPQKFDKSLEIPEFKANSTATKDATEDSDSLAAYEKELREGVTLQDKGGRLARRLLSNASRFSFEVSSVANSSHENLDLENEQEGKLETLETIPKGDNEPAESVPAVGGGLTRRKFSRRKVQKRWSNSDFSDLEEELANGTYDIDDDDMYFDDGGVLESYAEYSEDPPAQPSIPQDLPKLSIPNGSPHLESEGELTPLPVSSETPVGHPSSNTTPMMENTEFNNASRYSLLTHPHNRGADGSATPDNGPALPPFLNPIGAGLPYDGGDPTQYYALDGTRCDQRGQPLSLSALNYTLTQLQLQQEAAAKQTKDSNFDSTYEDEPSSFQFDDYDDDDDPIIAEANAEALACDQDNFYGSEFNFYATSSGSSSTEYVNGGYFAPSQVWPGKPGLGVFRQPSLTPISERSECSYRNSMVGNLSPNLGLSPNLSFFPTSPGFNVGVGGTPDQEMSLSQLLKFHNEQLAQVNSPSSSRPSSLPPLQSPSQTQLQQHQQQPQQSSYPQQQNSFPQTQFHHSNYQLGELALGVANAYDDGNEDLDDYEAEWDDGLDLGLEQVTSYDQEWEEDSRARTRMPLGAGLGLGVQIGDMGR